jgi:hypothetical protein
MVRRRLAEEPFTDSYELTDRGRKEYEALTPDARPKTWANTATPLPPYSGEEGIAGFVNRQIIEGGTASPAHVHGWDEHVEKRCVACGEIVTEDDAWVETDDGRWHQDCMDEIDEEGGGHDDDY